MYQQILTTRSVPVVTVPELAAFARFDAPAQFTTDSPPVTTVDWALLEEYIESATDSVETMTATACISEEILLTFDYFPGQQDPREVYNYQLGYAYDWTPWWWYGWPSADSIELVRRPVQMESGDRALVLNYMDTTGAMQIVDASLYEVFANKITLLPGMSWPRAAARRQDVIRIDYWAGYGEDSTTVPAKLKTAIKFLATWYYENRLLAGTEPSQEVAQTLQSLLQEFRSSRIPR
jgi:uncharacterized phiE125 gp8 family phage protein